MKTKKVTFTTEDFDEAEKGFAEVKVEYNVSPYEKAIMKELKKKTWVTPKDITTKYGYPERSIGSNLTRLERLGILKSKWEWKKAPDGRLRHYHMYTLKK
jgi:predicted DNA-binding ArsR family transcriptional regulator